MNAKVFGNWIWVLLAGALVWSGGAPGSAASPEAAPADEYVLESVQGNKVPCSVEHEGRAMKIQSGVFKIGADGVCQSKITFTAPNGKDVTRDVKATSVRTGNKLTMKWEGAGKTSGEIDGNKYTMVNEGMKFVYRK